ncbi:MAG: PadR family transcriptional regulator [Candidatus Thorarchaeota archaeon]|nr:MAG: PadR family transcriptional regulator [Candidatus Thorarchaeota archaeon]
MCLSIYHHNSGVRIDMRSAELKKAILKIAGKGEFYGYEIHRNLEQKKITIGIGRLYSILAEMKSEGLLKDRWEKSNSGPRRRVYRTAKLGDQERELILMEAIRTVHEFYIEYLNSLPPEHSAFTMITDLLVQKLPKDATIAYAASRFAGPVRKIISNLQDRLPEGNLYAIHPTEKGAEFGMENVSFVSGTFEDIPMKDDYLDLLVVSGNISSDTLDACLSEWQRVVNGKGTLAIASPTALMAKYKDPLEIGEFVEQREHPRLDSEDSLDLEILTNEMKKYFGRVVEKKVVHITVLRGFKPLR